MHARRLLKEPLLHFVLIGVVLFGAAELRRRGTQRVEDKTVVVDDHVRRQLADAMQAANGRAPSAEELQHRVKLFIDEEILYREGVARELHRDDERVRQRVADKMAFVIRSQIVVPPATDAQLRSHFDAHRDKYAKPELVDFVHVFVSGHDTAALKRAADLHAKLREGADPNGLGDRFSGGRRYRGRKLADLAQSFGPEFVAGMDEVRIGEWTERRSKLGVHLVKLERRTPPKSPTLEEVKLEVRKDWEAEESARRFEAALAELRKSWTIRQ